MSFSLDVVVDHPDGYSSTFEVVESHTYNLAPMWCRALRIKRTSDLKGRACADLDPQITLALDDITRNADSYRDLEPVNGWGDFDGFWEIFTKFALVVRRHPTGRVEWRG